MGRVVGRARVQRLHSDWYVGMDRRLKVNRLRCDSFAF